MPASLVDFLDWFRFGARINQRQEIKLIEVAGIEFKLAAISYSLHSFLKLGQQSNFDFSLISCLIPLAKFAYWISGINEWIKQSSNHNWINWIKDI